MNISITIFQQLNNKQSIAYSLIRIFLGVALFIRGYILTTDPGAFFTLDTEAKMHMFYSYISIMHLLGGFLLATGLFARLGALAQVPILFAAVFFVHAKNGFMMGGQSLELASLVLFLLVIFTVFGAGRFSLNNYFKFDY